MQRARTARRRPTAFRTVIVAALSVVAAVALAGCRSQPGVAAYVGGTQYTDASVEQMVGSVQHLIVEGATGNVRQQIVADEVFVDLAKRYAKEHDYPAPPVDASQVTSHYKLPADNAWAKLMAESDAYRQLLFERADAVTPTDAEVRDIFDRLVAAQVVQAGTYDQIKPQILGLQGLGQALAVKRQLADEAGKAHVTVNPRYQPAELPLLQVPTGSNQNFDAVVLSFGAANASPAVIPAQ